MVSREPAVIRLRRTEGNQERVALRQALRLARASGPRSPQGRQGERVLHQPTAQPATLQEAFRQGRDRESRSPQGVQGERIFRGTVLAILVLLLGSSTSARAQTPDQASIPQAFTSATNARNLQALEDLFTENAAYQFPTGEHVIGKSLVRRVLEADLATHPYDAIVGTPEITLGRAVWVRDHFDDSVRSLGVAPVRETVEAVLEDSRIRTLMFRRSTEVEARVHEAENVLAVVLAFEAAQNQGDVEAAVALFADDAVGVTADGTRWVGKDQIRTVVQHSWASGAHIERSRYQVAGDRVTSQAAVSSALLRAMGVGALQVTAEAVVRDGRIQSTTSTLSPESAARLQAAQNRAVATRFVRALNAHDLETLLDLLSPEVVNRSARPDEAPGLEGARTYFAMLFAGSPDVAATLDDTVNERDLIVARMTLSGTHTGELFGIEATGRAFSVSGIEMWRIQGGRIVERWGYADDDSFRMQLGERR